MAEAPPHEVVVRSYADGDDTRIRRLFHQSFGHELPEEAWAWKYRDHPSASHRITVAVADDGELLGHYGGYPVEWRCGNQPARLQSHQNGDVMTARRARRLGRGDASVLGRMARHFWRTFGEGHVDFHYGVNTGTARDLQLQIVPRVRVVEPVLTWTTAAVRTPVPGCGVAIERVSAFDPEWDAFVDRVADQYPLMSSRSARVMGWRYLAQPGTESIALIARDAGRIVGGGVFRPDPGETRWGDALFDLEQPQAAAATLTFLRTLDVPARIRGWFPARPERWAGILAGMGFEAEPEPRGLTLVYAPFTDAAERLVPSAYYTWGDTDLF